MLLVGPIGGRSLAFETIPEASGKIERMSVFPADVELTDRRSRQQLVITGRAADGYSYDLTRDAVFESADPAIAHVDRHGVVRPRKSGTTSIKVSGSGQTVVVKVAVGDLTKTPPVSFTNDVMAIVGKAGCNSGTCHGHNSGKAGFKLSLRGYDAAADFKALTMKDSGRVDLEDADESWILQMPTAQIDHGGGKRFEIDSLFHRTLRQWVADGAKSDLGKAVELKKIEVLPGQTVMPRTHLQQQLVVMAHFADGSVRDVTHLSTFELSNEGIVESRSSGLVTANCEGEAAVFVRFLGKMGLGRFVVLRHKPDFAWTDLPRNNFIDQHIHDKLQRIQVIPSELASDAEFLRRVTLDTTGRPPTSQEVRSFLADSRTDQRTRKIDELLEREEFGDQWALYWLELSGTTESGDSARFKGIWTLSIWLRNVINRNMPYDKFVRELVAGKGSSLLNPAMTFATNQLPKVETVPQLFLGVRINCAKCHDHPFDVWKKGNYRDLQQFFTDLGYKEGPNDPYGREIRRFVSPEKFLPWKRGKTVQLRYPDGSDAKVAVTTDRRDALVDWMFGPGKQMTARAIVNRVWGRLFGRGIIDPVDDMRFSNPPVNEPLLNALADDFIEHNYDFKHLVRTIQNSRTYQTSSAVNATNRTDRMNFSHAYLRQLPAEQLLDSIVQVTGVDEKFRIGPIGGSAVNLPYTNVQSRFLEMFGRPNERMSACECNRSKATTLPQVMHLVCGETVIDKIRAKDGVLAGLLARDLDDTQLAEELYITVLSRLPIEKERKLVADFFAKSKNRTETAEDVMWSLVTSHEFVFNH